MITTTIVEFIGSSGFQTLAWELLVADLDLAFTRSANVASVPRNVQYIFYDVAHQDFDEKVIQPLLRLFAGHQFTYNVADARSGVGGRENISIHTFRYVDA